MRFHCRPPSDVILLDFSLILTNSPPIQGDRESDCHPGRGGGTRLRALPPRPFPDDLLPLGLGQGRVRGPGITLPLGGIDLPSFSFGILEDILNHELNEMLTRCASQLDRIQPRRSTRQRYY